MDWEIIQAHEGRVVKNWAMGCWGFESANQAVFMAGEMLRSHQSHLQRWPESVRMEIRLGVASGEVLQVDGDTYGDAVNVASAPVRKGRTQRNLGQRCDGVDAGVVPGIRFRNWANLTSGENGTAMVFWPNGGTGTPPTYSPCRRA